MAQSAGRLHALIKSFNGGWGLYYCDPCWQGLLKRLQDGITGPRHRDGT